MIPTVHIVTADPRRADRYATALAGANRRHRTKWTPIDIDETVDVVLFDPDTVDSETVDAERATRDRPFRAIAIGEDVGRTARRVERAADKRRFELSIDARFDSLPAPASDRPSVMVPASLEATALRDLYETV